MALLQVKGLSFTYPEQETPMLRDISFSIAEGEFVVLCGETGCGKTTLLRLLKRELAPYGTKQGEILYRGTPQAALADRTAACEIGFVLQNPERQIVTNQVRQELAFGLESMGLPTAVIRRRVAEMASYFGIGEWFERDIPTLSGGQKQMLNLAAVMVMQPRLLILDEPTSQLDPIAAADFIATLQKMNRELSLTILLTEHRLEDAIPAADRLLLLQAGRLVENGAPRTVAANLPPDAPMTAAMPCAVRIHRALQGTGTCPLTVREGRAFLLQYDNRTRALPTEPRCAWDGAPALELSHVWMRYGREERDVLRDTCLCVRRGEIFCLLGGNASGKTTALQVAAGLRKPYRGSVTLFGKGLKEYRDGSLYRGTLAMLPQDVQSVFLYATVREELEEMGGTAALPFEISHLLDRHPYDLSGGEQQLCALAKLLQRKPRLLLLDEPTKGVDAHAKRQMCEILRRLQVAGMTILLVTHDVEFAAQCADRCALFFGGEITSLDAPRPFFAENSFYTTNASRMTRDQYDGAVTVEDVVALCRENGVRHEE